MLRCALIKIPRIIIKSIFSKEIGKQLICYSVTMGTTHYHIGIQCMLGSHDPLVIASG